MAMRVAFVAFLPKRSSGVERTLREKARVFASLRAEVDVVVVNGWQDSVEGNLRHVRFAPRMPNLLRYLWTVFGRYRLIEQSVDLASYDLVILRYPAADPSGRRFTRKFPTVAEHHTRAIPEMESYRPTSLSRAERFMKTVRLRLERRFGHLVLRNCRGLIGVTDEIRLHELDRANHGLPSITVANGIDVAAVATTGFIPFAGRELHIGFVCGSDSPWNGIDRLTAGLREYTGGVRITLHLIGDVRRTYATAAETASVTTEIHGRLIGAELDEVMARMNLAVSSLGLHRKQMEQACALKTREYVARGIPFVIGHFDPDLARVPTERRFFLSVPADESPINISDLIGFAREMARDEGTPGLAEFMRGYAAEEMSWTPKLRRYIEFCGSLVGAE
jgi:glycosyltransferase involved in cell wall biosynthesis